MVSNNITNITEFKYGEKLSGFLERFLVWSNFPKSYQSCKTLFSSLVKVTGKKNEENKENDIK